MASFFRFSKVNRLSLQKISCGSAIGASSIALALALSLHADKLHLDCARACCGL